MLIFTKKNLAYLAMPKTGTTAIERALRPHADIVFSRTGKHMPAARFRSHVAPFVKQTFGSEVETAAVMREPVDHLRSWYKYRKSPDLTGGERSTIGVDFDTFVLNAISDNPPAYADLGNQHTFLCATTDKVLVHHLFAYEHLHHLIDFFETRLKTSISLSPHNVSAPADANISDATLAKLKVARAKDFALYNSIVERDGYLEGEVD
ncbi:MAG: hypothetical protein AAF742_09445 [Pseudomonadota bacterium]